LLLFRLIWGIIGSTTARFSNFVTGPSKVNNYASSLFKKETTHYPGHNPLGGWMVVLLILTLLVQATTGLFCSDEFFFDGPLHHLIKNKNTMSLIRDVHEIAFDLLLVLASIHILAVFYYWIIKRENLILPMLTGYKRLTEKNLTLIIKPLWLAAIVATVVAMIIWFIVQD